MKILKKVIKKIIKYIQMIIEEENRIMGIYVEQFV